MRLIIVCFSIVICLASGWARDVEYEKTFSDAKKLYAAGNYEATVKIIREYLKTHGRDSETEYIVPLLIEALVRTNDVSYFKKLFSIYARKFPQSMFLPRLYYLDGIVKAKEQDNKKAVYSFSMALQLGVSDVLDSLIMVAVDTICSSGLSSGDLERLGNDAGLNPRLAEIIMYKTIIQLYDSGQATKAKKLAEDFRRQYPNSPYVPKVRKILSKSKNVQRRNIQIGLLAPVSGDNADIGKYVVQGVQLAVDEYNKSNTPPVELVIMDTRGNMVETARKVSELVFVHNVEVIIGPVLSANAALAAAALMDNPDVVMVTPTATDDGIARLGKNIFQMNVTLGILGKRIARYAVENLNIKEFAVITPMSEYGRVLTASFRDEVARCGGTVVAEEQFEEGTNDYRTQFESLRKKLAERTWEQKALEGRPEYGKKAQDKRAKESYLADSTIEIGGLFIPAESEDVTKLASQTFFYRLRTQLLGSNGWHNNATILGGKKYVDNAVFSTNFETDMTNETWLAFSKLFKVRFNDNADRVAAPLGYDAARLVLDAIKDGGDAAESIENALRNVKGYRGVSGLISFDNEDGVNSEAAILKISNKKFIRIQ